MAIVPNQAGFGIPEGVAHLFVNVLCQPSCKLWVGLKFGSNMFLVCHLNYTIIFSLKLASSSPPTHNLQRRLDRSLGQSPFSLQPFNSTIQISLGLRCG